MMHKAYSGVQPFATLLQPSLHQPDRIRQIISLYVMCENDA